MHAAQVIMASLFVVHMSIYVPLALVHVGELSQAYLVTSCNQNQ